MVFAFWLCAILAVIGALGMVFSKKAVHSALFVALTMLNLAVLYAMLNAPFLSMVQVIVYTGAVMMLFLFVLMVVGVDSSDSLTETIKGQRVPALLGAGALGVMLVALLGNAVTYNLGLDGATNAAGSNMEGLANLIFNRYLFAFEVTSALLITAAIGAMVLAHREHHTPKLTQRERAEARFAGGQHPGSLPAPGIYARHNAVDTPALLPDGTMSELSVPKPLASRGALKAVDMAATQEVSALGRGEAVISSQSSDQVEG
jgi:NADH-quinone oxidoreductase subunit J